MKKFCKFVCFIFIWLWQLPQHIVACLFFLFNMGNVKKVTKYGVTYYAAKHVYDCGISLGNYIFLDTDTYANLNYSYLLENTVKHEHGHQRQSKYLGWFYIIFIGIPSVCGNFVDRILYKKDKAHREHCHYYDQPWEHWADILGGVERRKR